MTELEKAIQETAETALGMLKKSQMSFDFSASNPHDHHKEYTRVNQSGTVSHIKAKGVQPARKTYQERRVDQAVSHLISIQGGVYGTTDPSQIMETMTKRRGFTEEEVREAAKRLPSTQNLFETAQQPAAETGKTAKPIWDSEAAVNDTKDIKRRLVAAGFKASEWSARADIVRSGARKGEIGDAIISYKYPLDAAQVVARTDSLLDAGFDVTWNTTKLPSGRRIIQPTIESVGRRGELKILDADKPVGQRLSVYGSHAEAQAALEAKPTAEQEHDRFWRDYKNVDLGKYNHLKEDMAQDAWSNAADVPVERRYDTAMAYFDNAQNDDYMQEMYGTKPAAEQPAKTIKGSIYITQQDNDHHLDQKASTFRDGFAWKPATITITDDPNGIYERGEFGVARIFGKKLYVYNGSGGRYWEIEGPAD